MGVKVKEKVERSGVWWIFINHKGRRKAKKIGRDKKRANEVAAKIEAKLTLGDFNLDDEEKKVDAFSEYAKRWLKTIPAINKTSTVNDYEGILKKHINPVFGPMPVDKINKLMVKEFLAKKASERREIEKKGKQEIIIKEGYAASTITHIKNAIAGVFSLAIDDEVMSVNPAHNLKKVIKNKSLQIDIDPLNREELALLLNTFKEAYPRYYAMALTLARTGMRFGEAIALQWGDIDFNSRFITIQRGMSRGKIETPKNGKFRRVDMSKQLTETLLILKKERTEEKLKKGWKEIPEWVFVSEIGTAIDSSSWRRRIFDKALEKAKLRKIRIHDLRHGYASQLIQAGESLAYIRDQLGHHSIKVTVDIYGHLAPEGNKAAVDRLDDDATGRNSGATKNDLIDQIKKGVAVTS